VNFAYRSDSSAASTEAPTPAHERSLVHLMERLPVIVFQLDRNLDCLYINPAVETVTGWQPAEFLGRNASEAAMGPELWRPIEAPARQVFSTGEPQRVDFCAATPIGKRHFECRLFPESETAGEIDSLIGIITDWTERKQTEDALRESEERYRALISHVKSYAIFAVDLEGRMTTWNEGVERLLGWEREEFLKLSIDQLFSAEDVKAELPRRQLHQAAEEGSAASEVWLHRKDGTPFFASGMFSRAMDASGHVMGFSVVLRDRTAWKRAQEERDALLESERRIRLDAEQASRLKDEFLATLSHELRSPLNAIVGWVHIARRHALNNLELARCLDTIERNVRAQTQIVNDLLDMSRIMTGQVRLELQNLDLREIIAGAVDTIRPSADAKRIQLETHLDREVVWAKVDRARMQQVLWNLLSNAVKFTPPGGHVRVTAERVNSHIEISVHDTGVGIAASFLPQVFDRFRQADASTTRRHGGLGLGLSIVKNLVELHGGTVRAASPGEGRGAVFTVSLPIIEAHPEEANAADHRTHLARDVFDSLPRLTGVSVLVVDDEVDSLMFLGRLLEDRGAHVVMAVDAEQALDSLHTDAVDILLSDIGMAGADGYQLIQQVRALPDERIARIPAIAVTAYARAEDRRKMLLAGFQMHISKPVEPQELIAGIASLIGLTRRPE
jgi:PAS domain S-box-containing protein